MPAKRKRNYRREYDTYHASAAQKKRRAGRNKARRQAVRSGSAKKGDGKDVHHKNHNPRDNKASNKAVISRSKNRSMNKKKR